MHPEFSRNCDRREFFRGVGRYMSLGILTGAVAWNCRHGLQHQAGSSSCIQASLCLDCRVFAKCGLPPALTVKKSNHEGPS